MAGIISSCHFFKKKEETKKQTSASKLVARAFDSRLYEDDIDGLFGNEFSKEDSIDFVKRYVRSWIKKQVLLKKSEKNIENSLPEIEKKVADYRYDMMVYEYQKKYINEKLNKTISNDEIVSFYEKNKSNFELKQNIVKCQFVKLRKDTPKIKKAIKWFKSNKSKDNERFKEFTLQFSDSYSFEDNIWYDFNDVVNNSPFVNYQNQVKFLKSTSNHIESDSNCIYFLKVLQYKISDETSPLEFVRDRVINIIINKRKVKLIKELEEGIYNQAKENKDFEIYK